MMEPVSPSPTMGARSEVAPRRIAWGVRPFASGDEPQVTQLYEECCDQPQGVAHYRWKLGDTAWPVGAPHVWLADTGERLIGQYAGTPMRFKLGVDEWRIVQVNDVMTSPAFRRQGVLTAVGTAATEAWQMAGVPFLTGLHASGWGSRRQLLGWREQFKGLWMWRPLRPDRLLARRNVPGAASLVASGLHLLWSRAVNTRLALEGRSVKVEPIIEPGPDFDWLWQALRDSYEALVVRDRAWVAYRYVEAPGLGYRLLLARRAGQPVGYLAYRLTAHDDRLIGWIADLFTAPGDIAARAALLRGAVRRLHAEGAESVRVFVGERTPLIRSLQRAGFWRAPGSLAVSIVPLAEGMPHPALRDPNRWFVMAGDFDTV